MGRRLASTTIDDAHAGRGAHPVFARVWALVAGRAAPDWRRGELLAGVSGRVLELGCGDGRNFRHYPGTVVQVVAIEPEPYLRRRARRQAVDAPIQVEVLAGDAAALQLADASCDAVVASLVLCSVDDQAQALAEIRRVLRPGGELRFYEHVVAHRHLAAVTQQRLDDSGIWPRLSGGCHLARDTLAAIVASGLTIDHHERFASGSGRMGVPIVAGIARRPVGADG